jgi:AcrR family transcriptional regulator
MASASRAGEKRDAKADAPSRTSRGEETKSKIVDAAMGLFVESGYEATTMRAIAEKAGVAVGNAYYYFPSKEHLIQAFYARTHVEHMRASRPVLEKETDFSKRLIGLMEAKLDTIEPYHRFSGVLFTTAADPQSPLNPFSDESVPTRRESTALFAEAVTGSKLRPSKQFAEELPNLLWIWHMGVVLFWLHDRSAGRKRTRKLIHATVPLLEKMVTLGSLPILRGMAKEGLDLVRELREEAAGR